LGAAKIIVTGLDNAGKTSLLIALEKKFAYEPDLKALKPTVRINRANFTFLNQQIIRWDFGGQEKYREEYLAHKERFFSDIDLFFYVVDVQDRARYMESIEYFEEILKFFIQKQVKIPIIILFNKSDPELRGQPQTEKALISLKDMFLKVKEDFVVDFFETSAFSIDTVMVAFSRAFARYLPRTELIANLFEEFAQAYPCVAILLLDSNGINIADYYRPQLTPYERSAIRAMRTLGLKLLVESKREKEAYNYQVGSGPKIYADVTKFTVKNTVLSLFVFSKQEETLQGGIQKFLPRVEEILKGILKE
jgi:small GTP-binding protein